MGKIMFSFQWPLLIFLLPLPVIIRQIFPACQTTTTVSSPEIRFPHLSSLRTAFGAQSKSKTSQKSRWPWILYGVWAMSVIALMRPQIIDKLSSAQVEGRDLMLAVDLSGSMQSLDFATEGDQANRLDVAKKVVKDFVEKRQGDRVGLVVFGEHAYLQSPLTLDHKAVIQMLENNLPGMAGDATSIGDAIGLAVKNLRDIPAQSKAIVLLTDGEDNASTLPPIEAAQLAKQYGIRIYTIVIGKEGEVPFPDGQGGLAMVESHVDTALTKQISEISGGHFYRATDPASLTRIYEQIDSLQKTKTDQPATLIRKPLFEYPLSIALFGLAILGLIALFKGESYELSTA
jgi:Ca-activated chloride channel family protein